MSEINFLIRKYITKYEETNPNADSIDVDRVAQRVTDDILESVELRSIVKGLVVPAVRQLLRVKTFTETNHIGRSARKKVLREARSYVEPVKRNENGNVIIPSAVGKRDSIFDLYFQVNGLSRKFGSLTVDEVFGLVEVREEKARQNQVRAEQLRQVGFLMQREDVSIVSELSEEAVLAVYDKVDSDN